MLVFLLLIHLQDFPEPWHLKDTKVYRSLSSGSAILTEDGEIFLLDLLESRLLHYNNRGEALEDAAARGEVPGYILRPHRLIYWDKILYVYQARDVSLFSDKGEFIEKKKLPTGISAIKKAHTGWIGLEGNAKQFPNEPTRLIAMDDSFNKIAEIASWPGQRARLGKEKPFKLEGNKVTRYYNPAMEKTILTVDATRRLAYIRLGGLSKVEIFDLPSRKAIGEIDLGNARIPFNREWGLAKLKMQNMPNPDQAKLIDLVHVENFPDYFPSMRSMYFTRANHLVIYKWKAQPGYPEEGRSNYSKDDLVICDTIGKPATPHPLDYHVTRVIGVHKDMSYFVYVTSDEEYTVARCPSDQLEAVLETWPLPK